MPILKMKPTPNGEGGSTVVANPTLVGDEPDLTGLQVEGNKYKVPQGGGIEYVELEVSASTTSGTFDTRTTN